MALSQSKVQQSWGVAMLKNSMDMAETQGAQVAELLSTPSKSEMELSVNPYVGAGFDMSV